jgi:hypothetical protein
MGTAFSEPGLIKLASGFEAVTRARRAPDLLPTLPTNGGRRHHGPRGHGHNRAASPPTMSAPMLSHL